MPIILGERRGHAFVGLSVVVPAQELAVLRNLHAAAEVLRLKDVAIEAAVQEEVVYLRDTAVDFKTKVVDDDPALAVLEVEVNQIRRFLFALHSGTNCS